MRAWHAGAAACALLCGAALFALTSERSSAAAAAALVAVQSGGEQRTEMLKVFRVQVLFRAGLACVRSGAPRCVSHAACCVCRSRHRRRAARRREGRRHAAGAGAAWGRREARQRRWTTAERSRSTWSGSPPRAWGIFSTGVGITHGTGDTRDQSPRGPITSTRSTSDMTMARTPLPRPPPQLRCSGTGSTAGHAGANSGG